MCLRPYLLLRYKCLRRNKQNILFCSSPSGTERRTEILCFPRLGSFGVRTVCLQAVPSDSVYRYYSRNTGKRYFKFVSKYLETKSLILVSGDDQGLQYSQIVICLLSGFTHYLVHCANCFPKPVCLIQTPSSQYSICCHTLGFILKQYFQQPIII